MASPVTIQPSTKDNYLRKSAVTTNMGADVNIEVYALATGTQRTLLSFDFSALVPVGATITLATLSLYCWAAASGRTITAYRLLRTDWNETQSTWNIFKTGSSWGTVGALNAGSDFTATDAATSASLAAAGWQSWNVAAQIQTALDSVSGIAHFLIADVGASAAQQAYYSRHYTADANKCPKLYIEYTVPSAAKPNFLPFFWA